MVGSMLGDKLLPESVQSRRRQARSKVEGLREPIRQKRQNFVPGPDVIGKAENTLTDLRNRAASRDSVLENIMDGRGSGGSGGSGNSGNSGSGSSGSSGSSSNNSSSEMV